MQNNVVKAFRQRLVRGGFKNIHISNTFTLGKYYVDAFKDGVQYRVTLTETQMNCIPRLVYFE